MRQRLQMKDLITVIILTHNEEKNLPYCLESCRKLGASIVVIDSGSQDNTVNLAHQYDAKFFFHEFTYHANQLNWALDNIDIPTPWCLRLDADERLEDELIEEIKQVLPTATAQVTGYMVKRKVFFWGRWIRFGGYYPTWLLRIWRTQMGKFENRYMDEHLIVNQGQIRKMKNDIIDENRNGLGFFIEKHNRFSDKEVADVLSERTYTDGRQLLDQSKRKRFLKTKFYLKAPLIYRAFLYWIFRYFVCLGFLDGLPGLVFHFLQGFWYRFIVDCKLIEARKIDRKNGMV